MAPNEAEVADEKHLGRLGRGRAGDRKWSRVPEDVEMGRQQTGAGGGGLGVEGKGYFLELCQELGANCGVRGNSPQDCSHF